jgi:ABC-type dipeptide/oligopeptide/nickel transport system permease component
LAVVVANLIAIPLGTISALKQNSPIDLVIRTISIKSAPGVRLKV